MVQTERLSPDREGDTKTEGVLRMREADGQAFDPRPALRDGIVELCGTLVIRLEMIRGMADLGDDIGLAYAFRCFRAEAKAMAGNVRDLCELLALERHAELLETERDVMVPQCD